MSKLQTGESTGTFHMENFRRRSRYAAVFAVLAAALFAILILNINTGTTNIPVSRILKIIFLREGADTEYNIIWKIRMPRILMAAILGGALSLSGFLPQTFFENPIAADQYAVQYLYEKERQEFKDWISTGHLKEQLSRKERITYHYRSKPNPNQHEFFEAQAVKIYEDEKHFFALVGFRHIDDIMEKETTIQNQLKQALDESTAE